MRNGKGPTNRYGILDRQEGAAPDHGDQHQQRFIYANDEMAMPSEAASTACSVIVTAASSKSIAFSTRVLLHATPAIVDASPIQGSQRVP